MRPLIAIEHLTFRYPAEDGNSPVILDDVSLEFGKGEFVAILGANGSGKTTLARHLNGLLQPSSGRVLVDGLDTRDRVHLGKIRQRVGMVFQYPENQIVATTVEEDVAFGPENLGLPASQIRQRVDEAIQVVGLEQHRQRPPHLLSAGQMQRLALAGVLAMRPSCIVYDEATTMLDPAGRRRAMSVMQDLRSEGMTIIFVTHAMEEAIQADRVVVLQHGRVTADGTPLEIFSDEARLELFGLEMPPAAQLAQQLKAWLPLQDGPILSLQTLLTRLPTWQGGIRPVETTQTGPLRAARDAVIEVRGLDHVYMADTPFAHPALRDVNFSVPIGGAQGLAGKTGSGKSTLLQHLNGLLRPQHGTVRVGPYQLEDLSVPTRPVTRLAGLVFQNPESQFFEQYVGDEIAYGPRMMPLDEPLAERVRWAMEMVGLDFVDFKDRLTNTLSGGQKRKVALASVLALKPDILLLDEPTAGLDPHSHREILERLAGLREHGMTLVVSSHRMEDLTALTDRLLVFQGGRVALDGNIGDVFWQFERLEEAGLEPPLAVSAAAELRKRGWPLHSGIVSEGQLLSSLQACSEAAL